MASVVPYSPGLTAVAILEKDETDLILWSWVYPSVSDEMKAVAEARSALLAPAIDESVTFSKFGSLWHYGTAMLNANKKELARVVSFEVVVFASDFNPEAYAALGELLAAIYMATGSPPAVLDVFLDVFAAGSAEADPYGSFDMSEYPARQAWVSANVKDLTRTFGEDAILLWAAMLLKRRIVAVGSDRATLARVIRTLPLLVLHRKDWDICRPFVSVTAEQVQDLRTLGHFAAGFTDTVIAAREDQYDVLIDTDERTVTVASHAAADFAVRPFVKDLTAFLVEASEDDDEETPPNAVVRDLAVKTGELLKKVSSLGEDTDDGGVVVSREGLAEKGLAPALVTFLYNIARAENLTL